MRIIRLTFCILLMAWIVGCASKNIPDPLAGWRFCFSDNPVRSNIMIRDDYQDYIQKLTAEERKYLGDISFFEDATGLHAVRIETNQNNECWYNVLIYGKDNKRVRVIKYCLGRYQS